MGNGEDIFVLSYPKGKVLQKYDLSHDSFAFALLPDESGLIYVGWDTTFVPDGTPDGKEVHSPENLYEYDFATGKERQLTQFTDTGSWTSIRNLDISPDRRWIVFSKGTEPRIYLLDRKMNQLQNPLIGDNTRFTPDGRLLFVTYTFDAQHLGTADLFIYDLATKQAGRVNDNGKGVLEYSPVMSPDGRSIAYEIRVFAGGEKASGLYVINSDGTNERRILGHDGHVYLTPDWGP